MVAGYPAGSPQVISLGLCTLVRRVSPPPSLSLERGQSDGGKLAAKGHPRALVPIARVPGRGAPVHGQVARQVLEAKVRGGQDQQTLSENTENRECVRRATPPKWSLARVHAVHSPACSVQLHTLQVPGHGGRRISRTRLPPLCGYTLYIYMACARSGASTRAGKKLQGCAVKIYEHSRTCKTDQRTQTHPPTHHTHTHTHTTTIPILHRSHAPR